jgi:hypothetical protein
MDTGRFAFAADPQFYMLWAKRPPQEDSRPAIRLGNGGKSCGGRFVVNELTETEKAYLAGFFDGDGCVNIATHRIPGSISPIYYMQVIFSQATREVLDRIQTLLGYGKVYKLREAKGKATRPLFAYIVNGKQAERTLCLMLPYLYIKKEQAEVALQFRDTMRGRPGCRGLSPNILHLREEYKQKLHNLKRGRSAELDAQAQTLECQLNSQLCLFDFDELTT